MLHFRWDTSLCADKAARRAGDKLAATQSRRKIMLSAERAPQKDALLWVEVVPRCPTRALGHSTYLSARWRQVESPLEDFARNLDLGVRREDVPRTGAMENDPRGRRAGRSAHYPAPTPTITDANCWRPDGGRSERHRAAQAAGQAAAPMKQGPSRPLATTLACLCFSSAVATQPTLPLPSGRAGWLEA